MSVYRAPKPVRSNQKLVSSSPSIRPGRSTSISRPSLTKTFAPPSPPSCEPNDPAGCTCERTGRAPYADVVQVLAVIRAAGVNDVGLVAEPETIER